MRHSEAHKGSDYSTKNRGAESEIVTSMIFQTTFKTLSDRKKCPQPNPSYFEWSYLSIEQTL